MLSGLPDALRALIGEFTGRRWLLPRVLESLDGTDQPYCFLLAGGPSCGESTRVGAQLQLLLDQLNTVLDGTAADPPAANPIGRSC